MATKKKTAQKKTPAPKKTAQPRTQPKQLPAGPVQVEGLSAEQVIEARESNKPLAVPQETTATMEELTAMAQDLAVKFTKLGAPSIICVANQTGKCTVEVSGDLYSIMQMEKTVSEAAKKAVNKVGRMNPEDAVEAIQHGLKQLLRQMGGENVDVQVMHLGSALKKGGASVSDLLAKLKQDMKQ